MILSASTVAESLSQSAKYWIYFTDKGKFAKYQDNFSIEKNVRSQVLDYLSKKSIDRRSKVLRQDNLFDEGDLPVYEPYIDRVQKMGGKLVHKSRWFNAASFIMKPSLVREIAELPFVSRIEPVKRLKLKHDFSLMEESSSTFYKNLILDYGSSYDQLKVANIIQLHDAGITGQKVVVGMLDSGYRWKVHESLQNQKVIAEYDFIFNDNNTANEPNDPQAEDSHGTLTFSVIGGYKPGQLIGAAFGSEFLLAKTEYDSTEYESEEDNWVAGIEWLEAMGADVVSSSLGYSIFDDGMGYFWENGDFDGRTSLTAQAAVRAARLGVLVCTAMGNEGNGDGITGTMLTPGDADSVISVGAVSLNNRLAIFSSTGPTNDNRIKPDIVAPGVNVYHAKVPGPDTYGRSQGTSLATPIAAGSAALLLSVRPELSPVQVRDSLRSTAAPADTAAHRTVPNNFTGWGLVDAFKAAVSMGPIFSNKPTVKIDGNQVIISTYILSKYGIIPDSVNFMYSTIMSENWIPLTMTLDSAIEYPTSGRYNVTLPAMQLGTQIKFLISGYDSSGRFYNSPSFFHQPYWLYYYGNGEVLDIPESHTVPDVYSLEQNYPNPFNSYTWIPFSARIGSGSQHLTLKVYNILGELIAVLFDGYPHSENMSVYFDAGGLPSGVYFYRLSTPTISITKKMILIR